MGHFGDDSVKEVLTAASLLKAIKLDVAQNALQAVCGYNSELRTYIRRLDLELYVITGNYVTKRPRLKVL